MIFLEFVSAVFGWVYTFCWSASFYGQPLLSYRRKSTSGTTADYPFSNSLGMSIYRCLTSTSTLASCPGSLAPCPYPFLILPEGGPSVARPAHSEKPRMHMYACLNHIY
jgi:hypothetical protein